jgi:AbrB family looped-hinge helix DNA binding protein
MSVQVRVDRQGRVVIPLRERERLGVAEGGTLELTATPEGVLLEHRRPGRVLIAPDGLPVITIKDIEPIANEETLDAIRRTRQRR